MFLECYAGKHESRHLLIDALFPKAGDAPFQRIIEPPLRMANGSSFLSVVKRATPSSL
jgi:hypothetical protein